VPATIERHIQRLIVIELGALARRQRGADRVGELGDGAIGGAHSSSVSSLLAADVAPCVATGPVVNLVTAPPAYIIADDPHASWLE